MKAKVIETGEVVDVHPLPTWYQEHGQGPDRREWDEDELEFIHPEPRVRMIPLDKACEWLRQTTGHGTFPYSLIEKFREAMEATP